MKRVETITDLLKLPYDIIEELSTKGPYSLCPVGAKDCPILVKDILIKKLSTLELWPKVVPEEYTGTAQKLCTTLNEIGVIEPDSNNHRTYRSDLKYDLPALVSHQLQRVQFPVLDSHIVHMRGVNAGSKMQ